MMTDGDSVTINNLRDSAKRDLRHRGRLPPPHRALQPYSTWNAVSCQQKQQPKHGRCRSFPACVPFLRQGAQARFGADPMETKWQGHRSLQCDPLVLERVWAHARSSVPVDHRGQNPRFEQPHCLMCVLQAVLYDSDMNVSFAKLLLSLDLDFDRSCAPRSHRDQRHAQSSLFRRRSLAPAARAERRVARQQRLTCFERPSNLTKMTLCPACMSLQQTNGELERMCRDCGG